MVLIVLRRLSASTTIRALTLIAIFILSSHVTIALETNPTPNSSIVDRIDFGNAKSESEHQLKADQSEIFIGDMEQSARVLLPPKNEHWEGGSLKFVLKVDPTNQNYTTIRLWGSDINSNRLALWCDDRIIGYRHLGDVENIDLGTAEAPLPGRFYFRTEPLPLSLTQGKNELTLELRATGPLSTYSNKFDNYQKPMKVASRGIYSLISSTNPYYSPSPTESLGSVPVRSKSPSSFSEGGRANSDRDTELLAQVRSRINRECKNLLNKKTPLDQMQMHFLARAYSIAWTDAYQNPAVPELIALGCDEWWREWKRNPDSIHVDPVTPNKEWFGLGLAADAFWLTQSDLKIELKKNLLNTPIHPGASTSRLTAWLDMFVASRDWLCEHRRQYTNQSMIIDMNIRRLDRAIQAIAPEQVLKQNQSLHYIYQSIGLEPWTGKETPTGPSMPMGDQFYQLTSKGLTRELGYVGSYGEVIDWVGLIYDATKTSPTTEDGDPKVKAQLAKICNARSLFRYPTLNTDGVSVMRLESMVGWRDDRFPGVITYAQKATWDAGMLDATTRLKDSRLIGFSQRAISEGHFAESLSNQLNERSLRVTAGLLNTPNEYDWVVKQPPSKANLPMSQESPDFAWADEEDGVVAIKKGNEYLYVSLYWRARFGINHWARFHHITPNTHRIATVKTDVEFEPSGLTWMRPQDWSNFGFANGGVRYPGNPKSAFGGEELPIAKIPQGIGFKPGQENLYAGKAEFYQAQFGPWFIVMNCSPSKSFPVQRPANATERSREWITGKVVDLTTPLNIAPLTTWVFWFGEQNITPSKVPKLNIADLSKEMYGPIPPRPQDMNWTCVEQDKQALGGKATRKQFEVTFRQDKSGPKLQMLVYVPNRSSYGKPPVIVSLNFWGNHTVHSDPQIQLCNSWIEEGKTPWCDLSGVRQNRATDVCRGTNASMWEIEKLIESGYAVSTMYRGDIVKDVPDNDLTGNVGDIFSLFPSLQNSESNLGAISAWAWAYSRQLDVLEQEPSIDHQRAICFGWSRLGKAALWAGANDKRFAVVLPHQSGSGGAKLFRRDVGENITRLTSVFPHWYCHRFAHWAGQESVLPWDQDLLLKEIIESKRAICIGTACDDRGADPEGEFLAAKSAGLLSKQWPAPGTPVFQKNIGYFLREGGHEVTSSDWKNYLDFLDAHFTGSIEN